MLMKGQGELDSSGVACGNPRLFICCVTAKVGGLGRLGGDCDTPQVACRQRSTETLQMRPGNATQGNGRISRDPSILDKKRNIRLTKDYLIKLYVMLKTYVCYII
jgi:hypothetical protein